MSYATNAEISSLKREMFTKANSWDLDRAEAKIRTLEAELSSEVANRQSLESRYEQLAQRLLDDLRGPHACRQGPRLPPRRDLHPRLRTRHQPARIGLAPRRRGPGREVEPRGAPAQGRPPDRRTDALGVAIEVIPRLIHIFTGHTPCIILLTLS